jgi:hypothetical protein
MHDSTTPAPHLLINRLQLRDAVVCLAALALLGGGGEEDAAIPSRGDECTNNKNNKQNAI